MFDDKELGPAFEGKRIHAFIHGIGEAESMERAIRRCVNVTSSPEAWEFDGTSSMITPFMVLLTPCLVRSPMSIGHLKSLVAGLHGNTKDLIHLYGRSDPKSLGRIVRLLFPRKLPPKSRIIEIPGSTLYILPCAEGETLTFSIFGGELSFVCN